MLLIKAMNEYVQQNSKNSNYVQDLFLNLKKWKIFENGEEKEFCTYEYGNPDAKVCWVVV